MLLKSITYLSGLVAIVLLTACASHIPPKIKQPLDGSPSVAQVRHQTDAYLSQKVRWGGVILDTENKQDSSSLTIVAFPLDDDGEPQVKGESTGRFIAIVDEFLEPLVFSQNREITVIGKVLKTQTLDVGEYAYEYPVIQVEHYYIWPVKEEPVKVDYPPYWWYDPYFPWHYPYYSHPRYH